MSDSQSSSPIPIGTVVAANLRRIRAQAELSLSELSRRAGVAKSTLSALESGSANPNIETLWALATALGVSFGQLVAEANAQVRIIRAGDGARVGSSRDASYAVRLLASTAQRSARDLYVLEAEPGRIRTAEPHNPGTVEHAICSQGRIRLGPTGHEVTIETGDYAAFHADVAHTYEALEPQTRALLIMEYPG